MRRIKEILSQYSISQRLYGEAVLGLSQVKAFNFFLDAKPKINFPSLRPPVRNSLLSHIRITWPFSPYCVNTPNIIVHIYIHILLIYILNDVQSLV